MLRLLSLLTVVTSLSFGQTFNARITGTVTDATGAAVPGATVTARNLGTNIKKSVSSGDSGVYDIPLLLPGAYEVTAEAPGLQTQVRRDLRLEVDQTVTLDYMLPVRQAAEAVEVSAAAPLLQSETSNVGTTVETRIVEQFPLPEHDVLGILRMIPQVISGSGVGGARGSRNVFDANFSVAGGRTSTNEVLLDGAPNTIGDFNGVAIVPSPDTVQEMRVETSNYSAEFGRSGGGVINIVTKSGTNAYHGDLYEYLQNTDLNANSFTNNRFSLARQVVKRNQYGFVLGGPVIFPKLFNGRNNTFFFASYEGRRDREPRQVLTSVPTDAEKNGDFSKLFAIVNGAPQQVTIYNPFTSQVVNGVPTRTAFTGNTIPANLINPVAKKVLAAFPSPNQPGNPLTGALNYLYNGVFTYARDLMSYRVDHYFSERHRLFARYSQQENLQKSGDTIVRIAGDSTISDTFHNVTADDTFQISPTVSNVFRYAYARFRANQIAATNGFDPTTLGLPAYLRDQANVLFYPNFSISGFPSIGGPAYNNQPRDTQTLQETVVMVRGRHNIKFGADARLYRFYPFQVFNPTGGFSFGQSATQQNQTAGSVATQGFGLASFLLGVGSFSFEHVEPLSANHKYVGAFVQDDWKITGRLTLNLGLRWDLETGTEESHNRLSYFDPNAANPIKNGPKGALLFTGNGNPGSIREANYKNFGPRVGFAYRVNDKTSARGGYGIIYLPLGLEPTLGTTPFNYTVSADTLNADYSPKTTLSDPFPGGIPLPASATAANDGSYRLGNTANVVLRNQPAGYEQDWNFGISRQLGRNMVVDATYNGSRGVHLPVPNVELNQIDPKNLALGGAYLTERVPNPYYGQFSSGLLSQPTIPREQLLKPFPQYAAPTTSDAFGASLTYFRPPLGDSIYHAVTVKFERRLSAGLSVNASYTFSKLIDIGGVGNGNAFNDPSGIRDIYNIRLERAVSNWDVPQRILITYSYDLPLGRGRRFLNHGGVLNQVAGGWSVLAFHDYESGRPLVIGGPDLSRIASSAPSRASVVAGQVVALPLDQARANARDYSPVCNCTKPWFNTAAFTTTPQFVIPNGPRTEPNARTDFSRNIDLSIAKNFAINERWSLKLVGEAYNLLNQVTFGAPNGSVNSSTFGSTGSLSSQPRRIEVGAKIVF